MEHLLTLDPASTEPLHAQLERRVREDVRAGRLRPGARLPATRALAAELGVSRGVVVEAYAQLAAEGWLTARAGSATWVAERPASDEPSVPKPSPGVGFGTPRVRYDLHPGVPDLASFPRAEWAAAMRRVLRDAPDSALAYSGPRGPRELREALAEHLGRARGVLAEPSRTLVCSGLTQGFGLIFAVLVARGVRRIALEDPGYFAHRMLADRAGLEVVPIPVDGDGLRVEDLQRSDAQAVVVTPAHQSPMGAVLSPERRTALLGWAREHGALIVEDDYDAEYRYDRGPVGALQGLAPDLVIYAGSASKVLAPALRLGWLVAPESLARELAVEKAFADGGAPTLDALVLADLLRRGVVDRHLRRTRRRLRARRDALVGALARHLPEAEVHGVAAGLHVVALVPPGIDEATWAAAARARGVLVYPMALQRHGPGPPGLVLGYANFPEPALERAVVEVAAAYEEARSSRPARRAA